MRDDATERAGSAERAALFQVLDALQPGIGFLQCDGTLRFANRAMRDLLEGAADGEAIRRELDALVRALCDAVRARRVDPAGGGVDELELRVVKSGEREYRLRGGLLGVDLFGSGPALLVRLETASAGRLPESALRQLYGFTRQEARVAELVAEGHTNAEIARLLFISEHTVRTHVARVLRKVGVRSRARVRTRIWA